MQAVSSHTELGNFLSHGTLVLEEATADANPESRKEENGGRSTFIASPSYKVSNKSNRIGDFGHQQHLSIW